MRITLLTKIFVLLIAVSSVAGGMYDLLAQDVIRASGGTNLSIDDIGGSYSTLTGPTIRETASGQLAQNGTIRLTLPAGYEWNTALTGTNITLDIVATGAANTQLAAEFTSINATEAVFTITNQSTTRGNGQGPGRIEISGLQIRPSTTTVPDEATITNTGTTGPSANYGDLSKASGSLSEVSVETAADGTGDVVQAQNILAGNSITVYAIGRDVGGNFIENVALENESDWGLIDISGDVDETALAPSGNLRSATFSSQQTGSAKIEANYTGVTVTSSEDITVLPRPVSELVINTQPSITAVAGEEFLEQPVLFLLDQFGNKVTTDNSTDATISINSGSGNLSGTLTQTAVAGEISFTDLSTDIANTINLIIESDGLNSVTTNNIEIEPNAPVDLEFVTQPTNTAQNATISPPVEIQLLDNYGNIVSTDGITISVTEEAFFKNSSTFSSDTDINGIATFDNLQIRNTADVGEVSFDASFTGINAPVPSNDFFVIAADDLAKFVIETISEAEIEDQIAGTSFSIRIRALDGTDNIFTDFNDAVTLTADSDILDNGNPVESFTTDNFVDGVLDTTITLTSAGITRIYAENEDLNRNGQSNQFSILPTVYDVTESEISASPSNITADGTSSSIISVQLKDEFGNNVQTGGENVELTTDAGSFTGNVTTITANDQNDGTYTSSLISSNNANESATISGTVNSNPISDIATVNFTSGDVSSFIIEIPQDGSEPANQVAGVPFNISIEAVDMQGNRVEDFNGTVSFNSNSTIFSGETATLTDGILNTHSITLTSSGNDIVITASADDLFEIEGVSESFTIIANEPDAGTSIISASPRVLQNNPGFDSQITIILRDVYNNRVLTEQPVSISLEQLEENGNPSSGQPNASLSAITWNSGPANYTATLNASTTIEIIELTGLFGDSPATEINTKETIDIVVPNTWTAGAGGPANNRTDWTNPDNWTAGVPSETDFVIIPNVGDVPVLDLNVTVGSFEIQEGVSLVLFGGNAITVTGNIQVDGTLDIEDNTDIFVGGSFQGSGTFSAGENTTIEVGGNISIGGFLARTEGTDVVLNGSSPQTISTQNVLAQNLLIRNDVTVDSGTDLLDVNIIDISEGNTLELENGGNITLDTNLNISGEGTFLLNDNTLVLRQNAELANIDASEGTVIFGIRLDEDFADFPDLQQQQIANLTEMRNAIINNTEGVRTFDDIIIDDSGTLTLENGELIISSGRNFIASNVVYNNGSLTFRRTISQPGWRMISTPVGSSFGDFFDGLTTQGLIGSTFPDRQPNILFYDETSPGTDNQRWRSPANTSESIETGRGYFFYVFGDVDVDSDYNDTLPVTLTASGQENQATASEFTFPVTYTAAADTGWNVMGNPFGATIDWDETNWVKENMDDVIYIWDEATNQYRYWNGTTGSHGSGRIAPFQSFWVKANAENPELTVNTSAKTVGGTFRKEADRYNNVPVIALELESDFYSTSTHFSFSENGSFNTDRKDAYRLLPFDTNTYLEIFSLFKDGTELAINNLPRDFNTTIKIPIQVGAVKDGSHFSEIVTLTWPELENIPESWTIELVDLNTDNRINLKEESFYDFEIKSQGKSLPQMNTVENFRLLQKSTSGSKTARFELHISPGEDGSEFPAEVELNQNYPNPFNPSTSINFGLPTEDNVRIDVYDLLGRRVQTLTNQRYQAGYHQVQFDGGSLASGIYFYRLVTSEKIINKRMTLIK